MDLLQDIEEVDFFLHGLLFAVQQYGICDRRATQILQQSPAPGRHVRQQRHGERGRVIATDHGGGGCGGDVRQTEIVVNACTDAAAAALHPPKHVIFGSGRGGRCPERGRDPFHGPFLGYLLGGACKHLTLVLGHRPPSCVTATCMIYAHTHTTPSRIRPYIGFH